MNRQIESNIQQSFVRWFRLQYPEYALNLISVPNGGARNVREAAKLKREGVTAGASDTLLLVPRGRYGALGIEFKTLERGSRQSKSQKIWQEAFERAGNKYVVTRTLDEAIAAVQSYMELYS